MKGTKIYQRNPIFKWLFSEFQSQNRMEIKHKTNVHLWLIFKKTFNVLERFQNNTCMIVNSDMRRNINFFRHWRLQYNDNARHDFNNINMQGFFQIWTIIKTYKSWCITNTRIRIKIYFAKATK